MNHTIIFRNEYAIDQWHGSNDQLPGFLAQYNLELDRMRVLGWLNTSKMWVPADMVSTEETEEHRSPVVFAIDADGIEPLLWHVSRELYDFLRDHHSYQYALDISGMLEDESEFQFFGAARYATHRDHNGTRYFLGSRSFEDCFYQSEYNPDAWFRCQDERDDYDESNRPEPEYVSDYHSGTLQVLRFDNNTRFWVGLEIEKEDRNILESLEIGEFLQRCPTWRKERDGSLEEDGFELISPMMQLNVPEILRHINNSGTLVRHINADFSDNCGGHINLSDESRSAWELFDDIAGYLPLLCALYPSRVHKSYCQAKPKHRMVQENEKYQAIKIHRDRIEIRIFPAVRNLRTLEFRLRLCEFMMKNPAPNPKMVKLHRMRSILSMIYPGKFSPSTGETKPQLDETKLAQLKTRIETFTQDLK